LLGFISGLSFQYNRECQWRLVWWCQRSTLEAGTSWCMLHHVAFFYHNIKSLFRSLVTGQVFRSARDSGWLTYNVGNISIEENFNVFSIIKMWLFS